MPHVQCQNLKSFSMAERIGMVLFEFCCGGPLNFMVGAILFP